MAFKSLIFFGLLAVALGFTLPEQHLDTHFVDSDWAYGSEIPEQAEVILVREPRSPQGRLSASLGHSRQMGSSATLDYIRPINKNWEVYAGASRNFKFNDNSGHAGLRYNF